MSFLPAAARAQQGYDPQRQTYGDAPQQRPYSQAELDALLAPVALYPDDVIRLMLDASTAPDEIAEAAQWSRVNQGMTGEDAVRAVQGYRWQPSVKALVAYSDLLERMAESPQWVLDLGHAWLGQQANVMDTVQALRQRAHASGALRSDAYQTVQSSGRGITVVPARPYIYYVPYYDPLVIYGGWWWPAYRPVFWRPWNPRPVFVTNVVVVNRGFRPPAVFAHRQNRVQLQPFHRVPEANRQPIVQSRGQPIVRSHVPPASPESRIRPAPERSHNWRSRSEPQRQLIHVAPTFRQHQVQQHQVHRPAQASGQRPQHHQQGRGRS